MNPTEALERLAKNCFSRQATLQASESNTAYVLLISFSPPRNIAKTTVEHGEKIVAAINALPVLIEIAQCVAKMEGIEKYLEETRGLPSLEVVSRRDQIKCLKRAAYAALAKLGAQ